VSSSATVVNLEVARRYLAAIEAGAVGDDLAAFFSPDIEQIEFPNRLVPTGARRGRSQMLEGALRGQKVLREQRYQVEHAFADGNAVVLEVLWVGTLAIDRGSIPAGLEMRAHFAVVLELRDGRITAQRNYDCFDPF
jgi:ketosteroid isomerase-like protein